MTTRRRFVEAGLLGGMAAALPASAPGAEAPRSASGGPNPRHAKLDEILRQPVLKRELFPTPVIIESLELLRHGDSFLCRVRSRDGAEGLSVGHSGLTRALPALRPQPAAVLHRQGRAGPGSPPGEGLRLQLQLPVQRHLHRHAARHDRVRHPRPAGTHRREALRPADRRHPSPGGQRLPGDGVPREAGRGIPGADPAGRRGIRRPRPQDQGRRAHVHDHRHPGRRPPRAGPRRSSRSSARPSAIEWPCTRTPTGSTRWRTRSGSASCWKSTVRLLRGAGDVRLARGDPAGRRRARPAHRRRRAGIQPARLPLAHRQRRARRSCSRTTTTSAA